MLIADTNSLYRIDQIRKLEQLAIARGITENALMERAGLAAFEVLKQCWPQATKIVIVCGIGNNAGDGYVLATLLKKTGSQVKILQLGDVAKLTNLERAAKRAFVNCQEAQVEIRSFSHKELQKADLIVDAILGIGLVDQVRIEYQEVIREINGSKIPVLAIDVPSGVDADSGAVLGVAVKAAVTVTFIGPKVGLLTGPAVDYTGKIINHDLSLAKDIFSSISPAARKLNLVDELKPLKPRKANSHKGDFGHVLVIGGDLGMGGAVSLAAEAALRVGAGLVSVVTQEVNRVTINVRNPEIMVHAIKNESELEPLIAKATIILLGPGLGCSSWGKKLFTSALAVNKKMLIDADGLNLLALNPTYNPYWILTPHVGEAARLLGVSAKKIQDNRFDALQMLQEKFGGTIVLKGAGSLVGAANEKYKICTAGNPGMATAGMGDLLSGVISGLMAQGVSSYAATNLGVLLHAEAGDLVAAKKGQLGILASDLLPEIRAILNLKVN